MGESRLTKRDCKFLSTLITECWKVCKKDGKRNLAPFMEKCNHLRKYLLAMCKQVNESSGRSFLTKFDFGKIMKLVMEYAWNAWDIGQLHYDWKEAEHDGHRKLVEDYLQSLCVEQVSEEKKEPRAFGDNPIKDIEPTGDVDQDFDNAMTALRDDNYEAFIADLNTLASDPKIAHLRDAIIEKFNSPDGLSVQFSGKVAMPIKNIHPTQFEVDMEKSLAYPLKKKPEGIKMAFSGRPVLIANTPLVVAEVDGVNYIIDGHHRWSQVYCLNPEAQMVVRVIKSRQLFKSADDVLKLVQMQLFIAKDGGELPQATVDSEYNLYTIDESNFKKWVDSTITDEATQLFAQFIEGQKPSDYLWNNVLTMRKEAQPTPNAHGRGDMPQTDQVDGEFMKPKAQPVSEGRKLKWKRL